MLDSLVKEDIPAFALAPLTPKALEELMAELPASERATIAWAPRAIALALERLYSAPTLSSGVLEEVTTSFLSQILALPKLLEGLFPDKDAFLERLLPLFVQQTKTLAHLPIKDRRAAMRALASSLVLGGIGAQAIGTGIGLERISQFAQRLPADLNAEVVAGPRSAVAVLAALHGIETGRARDPRTLELVALADAEALRFATILKAAKPDDPGIRVPWYFETGEDPARFRWFASWAEAQTSKNDRAFSLLESWAAEPAEPGEREGWEQVKRDLDLDRLSSRPLFP